MNACLKEMNKFGSMIPIDFNHYCYETNGDMPTVSRRFHELLEAHVNFFVAELSKVSYKGDAQFGYGMRRISNTAMARERAR